jgi:regulator of protease activity HflC (stomatin/prohibitin superfamily)
MQGVIDLIVAFLKQFRIAFKVEPWQEALRTRRGVKRKMFGKGIHLRLPFSIDYVYEVDMRPDVVDLQSQSVRTKDTVPIAVSGAMWYQVVDAEAFVTSVKNPLKSLKNLASALLAQVVNSLDDKELTLTRVKSEVGKLLAEHQISKWGLDAAFYVVDITRHRAMRHMLETMSEAPEDPFRKGKQV